jgi:hypothetical protein
MFDNHTINIDYVLCMIPSAYGKTAHTFEGATVGPDHQIKKIIIQPGTQKFEALCPGLFYMMLSRATTIGTPSNRLDSAIFFITNDMNGDRIAHLTTSSTTGRQYIRVYKRQQWVDHLNRHIKSLSLTPQQKQDIIIWSKNTNISSEHLKQIILSTKWRQSQNLNY